MVARWQRLTQQQGALLVEESPWTYLTKHAAQLPGHVRDSCHATLAQLTLPDLTFVLHTSGVAIGRRHPHHRQQPEEYSQVALRQMAALQFLPQPCMYVDASVEPVRVAQRIATLLNTKVFRAESAEVEGMQHLLVANPPHAATECQALADKLLLHHYTVDTPGVARLARLANIIAAHPTIVNPQLTTKD
jgi:hypothetical protein